MIFTLALYSIPFSAVEDVPVSKLIRLLGELEKKISELRGVLVG